ncbi:MAG: hypothetical protein ACTSVU_08735 [Promethearchaeota archaeon]
MTIEIDDSGTGDILGPAFILFWRRETNILIKKEVPLEIYQKPEFNQLSKEFIKELFIQAIEEMQITKTEDIHLCTGPCFDKAREYLKENEYNLFDAKIEGYLQDKVEQTYLDYLVNEYDFPLEKTSVQSGKERFFTQFHWLAKDFPRRQHYAKTGFTKWETKWKIDAENDWINRMVKVRDLEPRKPRRYPPNRRYQKKYPSKRNYRKKSSSASYRKKPNTKQPQK